MAPAVAAAKARKMDSGDDSPDFALEWAVKDMSLALDARPAGRSTCSPHCGTAGSGLVDQGLGGLDMSASRHGLDSAQTAPS